MILTFLFLLCLINGHYFSPGIGQERGENRTTAHCLENRNSYPRYYYFLKIIWPKIDMLVFCFLPAFVMILCNAKIICLLKQQRRHLENKNSTRRQDAPKPCVSIHQTLSGVALMRNSTAINRKALERQMSLMMAARVIVFLCTTVPVTIYLLILERVIMKIPNFARDNPFWTFLFRILRSLMYVHFGSNFYLYCLTSRIFRAEFIQAITCRRLGLSSNPEHSTSFMLNKIDDV
ncbi:unnamed protein product [Adineta ricciae]|uniref:G-protein coupled receptors family 1 profile domain-containing protein n=1 Tax=Adineta ricciae TaxID=249248 RepID=A0A816H8R4_ADIRI|nr:unnamed protein product [Adineta ricciae]